MGRKLAFYGDVNETKHERGGHSLSTVVDSDVKETKHKHTFYARVLKSPVSIPRVREKTARKVGESEDPSPPSDGDPLDP